MGQLVAPDLGPWTRGRGWAWAHKLRARGVVTEAAPTRGQVPVMVALVREGEPVIGDIGDPDPAISAPGRQLVGVRVIRVRAGGRAGGAVRPLVILHHPAVGVDISQPRPPGVGVGPGEGARP